MMNDDLNRRPTHEQPQAASGPLSDNNGTPTGQPLLPIGSPVPVTEPTVKRPPKIWPGMTPEQMMAYIESTKKRRSRKKPRPSLDKHRDFLLACVKGNAVMRQVFDDLTQVDPAVLAEFKPDGHRAFNACVKRMAAG